MRVKLVLIRGKPAGKQLLFGPGEYFFGRGPECQVRLNSEWVSRQHCLLKVDSTGASLRDLGSRNGTLVNGALLQEVKLLTGGDKVQVGPVTFEVFLDSSAVDLPATSTEVLRDEDDREPGMSSTALLPPME